MKLASADRGVGSCRQRAESERVVPHRIGRANADADGAVIEPDLAGGHAEERTTHRGADLLRREAGARRIRLAHPEQQLGVRLAHAVEEILEPVHLLHSRFQLPRIRLERVELFPEQLDLDRLRVPGQIIDDVGEDLHELDVQPRCRGLDLRPHLVDDFEDAAGPPAVGPEPRDDVTGVLLGGEEPQLGAGAA